MWNVIIFFCEAVVLLKYSEDKLASSPDQTTSYTGVVPCFPIIPKISEKTCQKKDAKMNDGVKEGYLIVLTLQIIRLAP